MTNAEFEQFIDTSDEWIVSRTGIHERRVADDDTSPSDMTAEACRRAMEMAGVAADEIDMLILGTVTPDYRLPSAACIAQEKLRLSNAVAFDIVAACTGFISGLTIADSFIRTGQYSKILVAGAEKLTSLINWADRGTAVLFGDGAGAAVVSAGTNGQGVLSSFLRSDGRMSKLLWTEVGGSRSPYKSDFNFDGRDKILMNGSEIFKVAVREMVAASERVLCDAGLTSDDVTLVVPHQANIRIIDALTKRLGIGRERVYLNIDKYGNTSAASVPLALDEANRQGRIKPGDIVLMVAFGGGLIWGATLVRW